MIIQYRMTEVEWAVVVTVKDIIEKMYIEKIIQVHHLALFSHFRIRDGVYN